MTDVSICVDCANTLGEGPLWDVAEQRLYWVDSMRQQIWRCAADGSGIETWDLPSAIGSLALRAGDGAVLALESGLHFFDFASGTLDLIAHPETGKEHVRLNDGKVDSRGRFVVGSLDMTAVLEPVDRKDRRGVLYRLDPDLTLTALDGLIANSNGPCWSPDNRTFYFTDSVDDTVCAYEWDEASGTPGNKREFARFDKLSIPDGATVDAEGYYWCVLNGAFSGRGELRRFAPDGTPDRTVPLPSTKPTSLAFGGPNLDIAFVTTMSIPGQFPETPYDGRLLAVHGLGVRGKPENRFKG